MSATSKRPLCLVTGASGFLGARLVPALRERFDLVCASRTRPAGHGFRFEAVDLAEPSSLSRSALSSLSPEIVLHAAVAGAPELAKDPERARSVNETAVEWLATQFRSCGRFVFCSTDLVFDGESAPYAETDEPRPISEYGRSKHRGEAIVGEAMGDRAVVARLALLYGWPPRGRDSFLASFLERARLGTPTALFVDEVRSPLYAEDAASQLAELCAVEAPPDTVHLAGDEACSRYEMGLRACEVFGLAPSLAVSARQADRPELGPRPRDVTLDRDRARALGFFSRPYDAGLRAMNVSMAGS